MTDPDALEAWAKTQPEAVQSAAMMVVIGLRHSRPNHHPRMRVFLMRDVEKLKAEIEAARE